MKIDTGARRRESRKRRTAPEGIVWRRLRRRKAVRSVLSNGDGTDLCTGTRGEGHDAHRLQFEGVISGRNQSQRNRAVSGAVEILRFKPRTEPGIVDFWLTLPEVRFETTLDSKMAELEFDVMSVFWKIATNIRGANVQSSDAVTFALGSNDHREPVLRFSVRVHG